MNIAFRVDASHQIGIGHVMRCLSLADALHGRGATCIFICRPHEGHLLDLIAERGHQVLVLPALQYGTSTSYGLTGYAEWLGTNWAADAADTQLVLHNHMGSELLFWLVVDHYALDYRWEKILRCNARFIMVIDDLSDRPHDCDLLLDQNLGHTEKDYANLVSCSATIIVGAQYALLRPEFAELRPKSLSRRQQNPQLKRLLVTMGGVDKDNFTGQVLDTLQSCLLPLDLRITVVMGPHAPWLAKVAAQALHLPWLTQVLVGVNNMAQLMADSDLAIGAAGSTAWERCCLGLPSIQIALAENQEAIARALDEAGAALTLTGQRIASTLPTALAAIAFPDKLQSISKTCSTVTQGQGVELVSEYMKRFHEDNAVVQ